MSPVTACADGNPAAETVWQVYLLECRDGTLYCGITRDLERRVAQHNGLLPGGARYTRGRRPVRLVASLSCPDKGAALRLELAVKARPRAEKRDLLCGLPRGKEGAPC